MDTKSFFLGIGTAIIIFLIAVGGYFLGKGTSKNSKASPSPAPSAITSLDSPDTFEVLSTPRPEVLSVTEENIEASIVSKNYAALVGYMVNPVSFRIEASECCPPMTPVDAVDQLEYLNNSEGGWDFNKEGIISDLQASFPEYYSNAVIGIASDNYLVAFQLNEDNQIIQISLSVDYNLLIP